MTTSSDFDAISHARLAGFYAGPGKRIFDLAATLVLAPVFAVILLPVLLLVALEGRPLFFSHERVGRGGHRFKVLKIRTMVPDAEARLAIHLREDPAAAREWEASRKLQNDPRITRLGRFLRATSLDELPQIWNVLQGDMSWVGPRPVVGDELRKYGNEASTYLAMKPGVTGIWQTSGRNAESYADRVRMDCEYRLAMGPLTDLAIILKTVGVVLRKTGL